MGKGSKVIATALVAATVYAGATGSLANLFHSPNNIYNGRTLTISGEEKENIINNVEAKLGYDVEDIKEDDYIILNAVLENDKLTEEEKEYFYDFGDMFYDNPYLNREKTYENLSDVDIKYSGLREISAFDVLGNYDYTSNEIRIYENEKSVRGHEITHCIYNVKPNKIDVYFSEGMAELLYNEYFDDIPFLEVKSYPYEICAVKMLCEICGSDLVLKAYSESNMHLLANEITKYSNRGDAYKNLMLLDDLLTDYETNAKATHYTDYDKMYDFFESVLIAKYGENGMEHNAFNYYKTLLNTIYSENNIMDYLDTIKTVGIGVKAYFNEDLKRDYNYFCIIPCEYEFSITDKVFSKN